ncbi:Uncharacterised protein [uncultured archaeon]|nr:Uncharacterised protein [uncultured archaeon]
MRETTIKTFVEEFLKLNKVKHSMDSNGVYTVNFDGLLANKLGKKVNFTFSRQTADDYGAEYAHPASHLIKTLSAFAAGQGLITRAKLDIKGKGTVEFDKSVSANKGNEGMRLAGAFLFKIASSNRITEEEPEKLRYVVITQEGSVIEDAGELIDMAEKQPSKVTLENEKATRMFKQATNHLENYLEFIHKENEAANQAHYQDWLTEAREKLNEVKRDCLKEENRLKKAIDEAKRLAYTSTRVRTPEKHLENVKKLEKELEALQIKNEERIEKETNSLTRRAEQEKEKYLFSISVDLCSALIFEYPAQAYTLTSAKKPDESVKVTFSKLTNNIEPFDCPGCKKQTQTSYASYEGWLCCDSCSTINPTLKARLSTKDKVQKCIITGEFVPMSKNFKCSCCNKYFKKEFLQEDFEKDLVCEACKVTCPFTGTILSKKKGILCEDIQKRVHPSYALRCDHTQKYYSKAHIVQTTGDCLNVNRADAIVCKKLGLTFARKNTQNGISTLYLNAQEIEKEKIPYAELRNQIKAKKAKFAENKCVAICIEKGWMAESIYIWNKKKKEFIGAK